MRLPILNDTNSDSKINEGISNDNEILQLGKTAFVSKIVDNRCHTENKVKNSGKKQSTTKRKFVVVKPNPAPAGKQ